MTNQGKSPTGGKSGGLSGDGSYCSSCQGRRNHGRDIFTLATGNHYFAVALKKLSDSKLPLPPNLFLLEALKLPAGLAKCLGSSVCEARGLIADGIRPLVEADQQLIRRAMLEAPAAFCQLLPGEIDGNSYRTFNGGRIELTGPLAGHCFDDQGSRLDPILLLRCAGHSQQSLAHLAGLLTQG